MFSTKEVILILVAVIGVLALLLQTAGIITTNKFAFVILILVALPIIHKYLGKD